MKKIFALILAIALVLTSVAAFAEEAEEAVEAVETVEATEEVEAVAEAPKGTPNINTFAKMTVKYNESNRLYTIKLDKAVDRLLIKWADKGVEPEELAVDENLEATAIAWGKKYMPGTFQYYATWSQNGGSIAHTETWQGYSIKTSEDVYTQNSAIIDNSVAMEDLWAPFGEVTEYAPLRVLYPVDYMTDGKFDQAKWDKLVKAYKDQYPQYKNYEIEVPTTLDNHGYIQGSRVFNRINKNFQTVIATPDQAAFLTVQNGWAVYYNRAGKIVGIEFFEGQF